jgi:CrcB protein
MFTNLVFVAAGGALGACARFLVSWWLPVKSAGAFPWATFLVNVSGCLLIGLLWNIAYRFGFSEWSRLFLFTGLLGGFTTFSSFGLETFKLLENRELGTAVLYVFGTNIAGIAAVYAGYYTITSH